MPGLVQRLAVAARRRRRRIRLGVFGAAVTIVVILAAGGIVYTASQPTISPAFAMAPLHQSVITASLSVTPRAWGTRFDWTCRYPLATSPYAKPVSYDLVVVTSSGLRSIVATWRSTGPSAAGLTASSNIAYGHISGVEIRLSGSSTTLLRENL